MSHELRWCPGCEDEQAFELPPCEDGHGEDCLDLSCTMCGHAVTVGVLLLPHEDLVAAAA